MRNTILEVARETEQRSLRLMKAFDEKSLAKLREVGTLKLLTPQEKKAWGAPLRPAYDAWVKECEKKGFSEEARKIMEALDRAR